LINPGLADEDKAAAAGLKLTLLARRSQPDE